MPVDAGADEIWGRIIAKASDVLRVVKWTTPEDLQDRPLTLTLSLDSFLGGRSDRCGPRRRRHLPGGAGRRPQVLRNASRSALSFSRCVGGKLSIAALQIHIPTVSLAVSSAWLAASSAWLAAWLASSVWIQDLGVGSSFSLPFINRINNLTDHWICLILYSSYNKYSPAASIARGVLVSASWGRACLTIIITEGGGRLSSGGGYLPPRGYPAGTMCFAIGGDDIPTEPG